MTFYIMTTQSILFIRKNSIRQGKQDISPTINLLFDLLIFISNVVFDRSKKRNQTHQTILILLT